MNCFTDDRTTWTLLPLLLVGLVLTGCDSSGSNDGSSSPPAAEISGQATTSAKAAKADVEGATVTAVSVTSDGDTDELDGETTTNANGTFELNVEGTGARGIVIVTAEKPETDFEQSAIVKVNGQSSAQSAVLTRETTAEASVYLEAEQEDNDAESGDSDDDSDGDSDGEDGDTDEDAEGEDEEAVTAADVVAHVDAELAADINSGSTDAQAVAKAITGGVLAEEAFFTQTQSAITMNTVEEEKETLFLQLQSDLSNAENEQAREDATEAFEESYADVYVTVGAAAETQAKVRQAATSTVLQRAAGLSTEAQAEVKQKTELFQGLATATANEARFEARGATASSITALQEARTRFAASVRANATARADAIEQAKDDYAATVQEQIAAGLNTTAAVVTTAEESFGTALQTLNNGLDTDPTNTADAYVTFYGSAESSAQTSFEAAGVTEAEAAADVLVLTQASAN